MDAALRKVIFTVLLLTAIYVLCWSPYWVSMFAHNIFAMEKRSMIIVSYFIHLLPYVSCVAYPLIFTLLNRGIEGFSFQVETATTTFTGLLKSLDKPNTAFIPSGSRIHTWASSRV
ncbi:unnamed protein product [Nippostrongylus brasiliensis]|uniref:Probable G-protein coupled receptor (inferred by orthology to a C. elegans protein) n=1 Tax=Nippostrongylus brasiliensis TaxID=27835 RepID=A0A158R3P6_NIPBR|nr:unnamed protein product [Nippostrongylus brasiliensis]